MENNKYITVKELYGELLRNKLLQDLTLEEVISYVIDFCRKWGFTQLFEEKIVTLQVEDYRVKLPCDFYELIALRDTRTRINYRHSTDVYHRSEDKINGYTDYTYKLNGDVIFLSTKDNEVEVVYNAMSTDEEGFPLIHDDATYVQALKDYIKMNYYTNLFDEGKINMNVLQNAQQQYGFSARVLRQHIALPTPDEAESMANIINNMVIHRGHYNGYLNTGEWHKYKNH